MGKIHYFGTVIISFFFFKSPVIFGCECEFEVVFFFLNLYFFKMSIPKRYDTTVNNLVQTLVLSSEQSKQADNFVAHVFQQMFWYLYYA